MWSQTGSSYQQRRCFWWDSQEFQGRGRYIRLWFHNPRHGDWARKVMTPPHFFLLPHPRLPCGFNEHRWQLSKTRKWEKPGSYYRCRVSSFITGEPHILMDFSNIISQCNSFRKLYSNTYCILNKCILWLCNPIPKCAPFRKFTKSNWQQSLIPSVEQCVIYNIQ